MTRTRKELADIVDAYDRDIAQLQESKREAYQDYRQQLSEVMGKEEAKAEVEAFKLALKRRNAIIKHGETAIEEKDALVKEILGEISGTPLATHVARRARADVHAPGAAEIVDPLVASPAGEPLSSKDGEDNVVLETTAGVSVSTGKQVTDMPTDRELSQREASGLGDNTATIEAAFAQDDLQQGQTSTTTASQTVTDVVADVTAHSVRVPKSGPIRPYCLKPELCGSKGGRVHCNTCTAALAARGIQVDTPSTRIW